MPIFAQQFMRICEGCSVPLLFACMFPLIKFFYRRISLNHEIGDYVKMKSCEKV